VALEVVEEAVEGIVPSVEVVVEERTLAEVVGVELELPACYHNLF